MGLFSSRDEAAHAKLARIERKLDAILTSLGIAQEEEKHQDVRAMAASGDKIGAIKLYREKTGAGLMEAKQFVDSL